MSTLTTERIAELRRLAEAATPGPWLAGAPQWRRYGPPYRTPITAGDNGTVGNILDHTRDTSDRFYQQAKQPSGNAAYIAAADPSTILALIADLAAAREALASIRDYDDTPDRHGAERLTPIWDMKQIARAALEGTR